MRLSGQRQIETNRINKANELSGDDGNDYIAGHAGDDIVFGGPGNHHQNGASATETLFAEEGDGVLFTDLTADAFQTVSIDDTSSLDWAFLA